MRKIFLLALVAISFLLASCGSSNTDAPAKAVEDYLNALVAKDADLAVFARRRKAMRATRAHHRVAAERNPGAAGRAVERPQHRQRRRLRRLPCRCTLLGAFGAAGKEQPHEERERADNQHDEGKGLQDGGQQRRIGEPKAGA